MNGCYALMPDNLNSTQSLVDDSFIGGLPKLPVESAIPTCGLCRSEQSFMFQVAFPHDHNWAGLSLAVFECTSCADENHLIPQMLPGILRAADIPRGFLDDYQSNFRILVFPTELAAIKRGFVERVKFRRLRLVAVQGDFEGSKIGGDPTWLLEDESPKSYGGEVAMFFLMQLEGGFKFLIHDSAPAQIELGLDGSPQPSRLRYYQLFNGNAIYMFGTEKGRKHSVYAITQID